MKGHDICSPRGPRLGSHGCPVLDYAPSWPGRSKAHSQPIRRKTFDGLLPVACREPPQPGTPPVFQVGDSFLQLSQSLTHAVVLASSRQTSASSSLPLKDAAGGYAVALGFFSLLTTSHVIFLRSETPRLVLSRKSIEV